MKNKNTFGLIMAGGIGSRFWPVSTEKKPKQFLDILGMGKSLLQITYERLCLTIPKENIYVLTNKIYIELVLEQLPALKKMQVLAEPKRKNTAPCIAYASAKIHALNKNATLVISPSDHLIIDVNKFCNQLETAINNSKKDNLVVLGIKPTRPDTGYGYIEFNSNKDPITGAIVDVARFCEKPNKSKAESFLKQGNFFWNAGIFVLSTKTAKKSFKQNAPTLYNSFYKEADIYWTKKETAFIDQAFEDSTSISFDYAIMEKAKNITMVLTDFDWSDLGTWGSVKEEIDKDENNNASISKGVYFFDSENCLFRGEEKKKYIIEGLKNFILIDSKDKFLLIPSDKEEFLKERLKQSGEKI